MAAGVIQNAFMSGIKSLKSEEGIGLLYVDVLEEGGLM